MRSPTPLHTAMAWWRDALAGKRPPIFDDDAQPGFYRRRLVRHGPYVPVRIWLSQVVDEETGELLFDELLLCEVDGRRADAGSQWSYVANSPISEADFTLMSERAAWARAHADNHPAAAPNRAVDWSTARIPF